MLTSALLLLILAILVLGAFGKLFVGFWMLKGRVAALEKSIEAAQETAAQALLTVDTMREMLRRGSHD